MVDAHYVRRALILNFDTIWRTRATFKFTAQHDGPSLGFNFDTIWRTRASF